MSTILYGTQTRAAEEHAGIRLATNDDDNDRAKRASAFAQRLAALVPAEVLLVFGFALAGTVTTGNDGTTTIDKPGILKWSIPILAAFAVLEFVIAKRKWTDPDFVRMLVPPLAFIAWTLVTGSAALSLWGWFDWVTGVEQYVGGLVGAVALLLAVRFTPQSA